MLCPTDNTELKIAERQGIEIDYCPKCRGVWLDRGELDKIIERSPTGAPVDQPMSTGRFDHDRSSFGWEHDDDDDFYRRRGRRRRGWLGDLFDFD